MWVLKCASPGECRKVWQVLLSPLGEVQMPRLRQGQGQGQGQPPRALPGASSRRPWPRCSRSTPSLQTWASRRCGWVGSRRVCDPPRGGGSAGASAVPGPYGSSGAAGSPAKPRSHLHPTASFGSWQGLAVASSPERLCRPLLQSAFYSFGQALIHLLSSVFS